VSLPKREVLQITTSVCKTLSIASQKLGIPLIVTRQYPKAFGPIVPEIDISHAKAYDKTKFSMLIPEIAQQLANTESVVLFGIEAHVCVLQTALDLLVEGKDVHLVIDGTSSQRQYDRLAAFSRLKNQPGVFLTTCESLLFQLLGDASHPTFKEISNIVKAHNDAKINPDIPVHSL